MASVFIVYPTNIDYLIQDVRLHTGDYESVKFSDSIVRSAIIGGVKMLQRRWNNRYLVFDPTMTLQTLPDGVYYREVYDALVASGQSPTATTIIEPGYTYVGLPNGYATLPSGMISGDVFRNPYQTFEDTSTSVIVQTDEYPIILMAAIIMRRAYLTGNAENFVSWSDGEFTVSSIQSSRILSQMLSDDTAALDLYFKRRLSGSVTAEFPDIIRTL